MPPELAGSVIGDSMEPLVNALKGEAIASALFDVIDGDRSGDVRPAAH